MKQQANYHMRLWSLCMVIMAMIVSSCSMTKNIPEDEQLFVGLKPITYTDAQTSTGHQTHLETTMEELEAALASEPNGSLFGSSYYTVPWSWHLWIYNKFSGKESRFAKWMTKSFGKAPVLMSQVNPALRASVARSVLRNNGFFHGDVSYEVVPKKNPRKCKIAYTVRLDSLFIFDTLAYVNFPDSMRVLIDSTRDEQLVRENAPFSLASLDGERTRVGTLLRNNGYYFYTPSYASYLADTFMVDNRASLRLQLAEGLPDEALRKWYIGHIDVQFHKTMREALSDSLRRRHLTIHYNGHQSPIRPGVVLRHLRLRPGQEFNYDSYQESVANINSTGVFSRTDFQFTPRLDADTLDLSLNCIFDKPYDFYIEGNAIGRTVGRYGPEAKIGFTRRNVLRGGEKLDINLHGSYEWQHSGETRMSTYQYGADAAIEFPRIVAPFYNSDRIRRDKNGHLLRRRFFSTPSTYAKVSTDIVRRPEYYKMHIVSGEWTYRWNSSQNSAHEFSPLTLTYQYMNSHTETFDSIITANPYLSITMDDYFIPKMRYTYTYTSPATLRNPIRWETTLEESGNIVSLWNHLGGHRFNEKDKTFFKTPYSQFLRLETDLTKTWTLGASSSLVGHVNAGMIWSYGNSTDAPFSELFYAGGANSIRAFSVRSIGPGSFRGASSFGRQFSYVMQNGDAKFVANLEYRTRLFGDLHGALFLDAGNVWKVGSLGLDEGEILEEDGDEFEQAFSRWYIGWIKSMKQHPSGILNEVALGTGIGLRYDLGFLVIRIDWGLALHTPYDTGKSGYFNINRFKDAHTLHFAIGYPF